MNKEKSRVSPTKSVNKGRCGCYSHPQLCTLRGFNTPKQQPAPMVRSTGREHSLPPEAQDHPSRLPMGTPPHLWGVLGRRYCLSLSRSCVSFTAGLEDAARQRKGSLDVCLPLELKADQAHCPFSLLHPWLPEKPHSGCLAKCATGPTVGTRG